jgi:hypothetical protein
MQLGSNHLAPIVSSDISCHMTSNSDTLMQLIESEHHPSDEDDGNCKSSETRQAFVLAATTCVVKLTQSPYPRQTLCAGSHLRESTRGSACIEDRHDSSDLTTDNTYRDTGDRAQVPVLGDDLFRHNPLVEKCLNAAQRRHHRLYIASTYLLTPTPAIPPGNRGRTSGYPRPIPPLRYHEHGRIPNHQFDSACKRPKPIMVSTSTSISMMTYKADVLSVQTNAPRAEPAASPPKKTPTYRIPATCAEFKPSTIE